MDLPVPNAIAELIKTGRWDCGHDFPMPGALRDAVPERLWRSPQVYLEPPPFRTIAEWMEDEREEWWRRPVAAVSQLDPNLAVVIADFGMGSDTPVVLDYRSSFDQPIVRYLFWSPDYPSSQKFLDFVGNSWEILAPTPEAFLALLGLNAAP
jgi:hypothetical protein